MAAYGLSVVVRNEAAFHFFMAIWADVCRFHLGFPFVSFVVGRSALFWVKCRSKAKSDSDFGRVRVKFRHRGNRSNCWFLRDNIKLSSGAAE